MTQTAQNADAAPASAPATTPDAPAAAGPTPAGPAPTIYRADYQPPAWLVPHIEMNFDLGLEETTVTTTLHVARNAQAAVASQILQLRGDGLAVQSLLLDDAPHDGWQMDGDDLLITLPDDAHRITITTRIHPAANTQLMGLYASNGMLCTQCEAEGFRRITFHPDRPDVMSIYRVRMAGDKALFPILLSNGNLVGEGDDAARPGFHWAQWDDPFPKPSYLFALVAGDLVAHRDGFTTMSGRHVDLAIWVRAGDETRTHHAMQALQDSMAWDEAHYGREYDLALFNIVAVADFNMGAMENKGLNVFNTRYILADPETATDGDYDGVASVVAHEYFHNWSGNRVTCRDWFQLSLKEGFTVLRDQQFSADMGSAPVKRIEDVRVLRGSQFPEDSGPLAHPIRPDSFQEISNFYTATIYNKGAEVIRMMRVMAGAERYRAGTDLYFDRHDGQAATCEDFIRAMEDGAGLDLTQFRRWYEQAGTPRVAVQLAHDPASATATLTLSQTMPATPGQPDKLPMVIPLQCALLDRDNGGHAAEEMLLLNQASQSWTFPGHAQPPLLSINRGFSAPVAIDCDWRDDDLAALARLDDDPFARYEAMQQMMLRHLMRVVDGALDSDALQAGRARIGDAIAVVLEDASLDDLMRGELLILPSEGYLAEQWQRADSVAIRAAREGLKAWLAAALLPRWTALHDRVCAVPFSLSAQARGARKLKTQALVYLGALGDAAAAARAFAQYEAADNMTDRQAALMVLCAQDAPQRAAALADFHTRFAGNALVIDKWFTMQAGSLHRDALAHVEALAQHPDFTISNPNRVRALYMAFAANLGAFHAGKAGDAGAGYRLIADLILRLDPVNAQTAARFVPSLGRWKQIEPGRAALMQAQLQRIAAAPALSRDVREQVEKSLV